MSKWGTAKEVLQVLANFALIAWLGVAIAMMIGRNRMLPPLTRATIRTSEALDEAHKSMAALRRSTELQTQIIAGRYAGTAPMTQKVLNKT